jgi:hypothetical protein
MSLFSGIATGTGAGVLAGVLTTSGGIGAGVGVLAAITSTPAMRQVNKTIGGTNIINGLDTWAGAAAGFAVGGPLGAIAGGLLGSLWGNTTVNTWDNSGDIAGSRATESKKYQTMNRSVADVKASMGIQQLSQADSWLKNKANEQNTITQTTVEDTSSWFGLSHDSETSYRYWQESNDQLLGRYGYETYAQKATNLTESLKWMEVKDMNKLNSDVLLADVKDTAGQDVERQIAGNQMNNYFGQYYVDAAKV